MFLLRRFRVRGLLVGHLLRLVGRCGCWGGGIHDVGKSIALAIPRAIIITGLILTVIGVSLKLAPFDNLVLLLQPGFAVLDLTVFLFPSCTACIQFILL